VPSGPCPDWREVVAAEISLAASGFCLVETVFDADRLVDRTTGVVRRIATERYASTRAVRELRNRDLEDWLVSIWRISPAQ